MDFFGSAVQLHFTIDQFIKMDDYQKIMERMAPHNIRSIVTTKAPRDLERMSYCTNWKFTLLMP